MFLSFRYSYENREEIDGLVENWSDAKFGKEFIALAGHWVDPEAIPDPLVIHFLPTKPELRYCSDEMIVDTGVLLAGETRQLTLQLVALLYRNLEFLPRIAEDDPTGEIGVINTFRTLMNEGFAAWIERSPYTIFGADHYSLQKVSLVPENFFLNGVRSIQFLNEHLPKMFADPERMATLGPFLTREAAAGGTLAQAGYAMVATIVHHLGEDRLLACRGSAADFLTAYQEAAAMNPEPRPVPGAIGSQLEQSMGPLDPELVGRLQPLLHREFPR